MKRKLLIYILALGILFVSLSNTGKSFEDKWYNNPLGFSPLDLHTRNGFLIPAVVAGACLLLTDKDSSIKKKISIYNESGFYWGYKYPQTSLSQNITGINFHVRKWMSLGVDIGFYFPRDAYNNTVGFAIRPFARFYPINNEFWRLYFESGGGLVYFDENFPKPTAQDNRLGTYLNGTTKYGIGSEINLNQSVALLFGFRHVHVSNGNSIGVERNPSHDSNGFFLGFTYYP